MDASRHSRLHELFEAAVDLAPEERRAFMAEHCTTDETRDEVEGLIAEDARQGGLLDGGVEGYAARMAEDAPRELGPYRLEKLLGEGGMGVVYLGRREDLGSLAAVKILRDAWLSPARRERFRLEQRTLAQLNHPNIAHLYDADSLPDGTPWFAMEYVEGKSVTQYCSEKGLPERARLEILLQVCDAVQHAHEHAIIHRDLKPSNILVTAQGSVKLLDFGIAKQLGEGWEEVAERTQTGFRMLTPAYAAPEQLRGERIGVYTDVYALGLILRELLPGRLPADLELLSQTALHAETSRRYRSVEALGRDLRHYLAGEPLEARADTFAYRTSKFVQRNRGGVLAGGLTALAFVLLASYYTWQVHRARNEALAEAARNGRIMGFLLNLFSGGDAEAGPANELRVTTLLDRGVQEARALRDDSLTQSELYRVLGDVYRKLGQLEKAAPLLEEAVQRRRDSDTLSGFALLRSEEAKHTEAEKLAREAYAQARNAHGEKHPSVARAAIVLGKVLEEKGDYGAAIPVLEEAMRIFSQPGQAVAEYAQSVAGVANIRFYRGEYAESEKLNRQALQLYRGLYGDSHPIVGELLINLGAIQQDTGNYVAAEKFHREALSKMQAYYGPAHPKSASTLTLIGRALILQKRQEEAVALLHQALSIRENAFGPNHPQVASTLNELGIIALGQASYSDAEAYFQRIVRIYESSYQGKHYLIGIGKSNLASVYMKRNEWAKAEPLFRDSLAMYAQTLPSGHVNEGIGRIKLGRTLLRQQKFAEAEQEIRAGTEILSKQTNPAVTWLESAKKDMEEITQKRKR